MHTETSGNVSVTIDALAEWCTTFPTPAHQADDADRLAALRASMDENGWVGAPVLVDGEQALTGSHRITAAAREMLDAIPRVEVRDLAAAYGIDWDALVADQCGDETLLWYRAAIELADLLSADVVAYLGMDLA